MLTGIGSLLARIRVRDAIIFAAPSFVGLVTTLPGLTLVVVARGLLLAVGSVLLMAYIFAFNDWADIGLDQANAQKRGETFVEKGIARPEMLGLSIVLAGSGVLLLGLLSLGHAAMALMVAGFGLVYSLPINGWQGKGTPILSSCLHLVTIFVAFLLGSMTYAPIDSRGILLGAYLAILITAGHLVQETQDYHDDRQAGIQTNAVYFGQKAVLMVALALFFSSFIVLVGMAEAGLLPRVVKYVVVFLPVLAVLSYRVLRTGLERHNIKRFRSDYRRLYAAIVFLIVAALVAERGGFL